MSVTETIDLEAYLARVGYRGPRHPSRVLLEDLHLAHSTHIPFENLDILLGKPILLDARSLEAKLVRGGRGGYCFEHNTLFAMALEQLGFKVTRLAARVRLGVHSLLPRTHMLLALDFDGMTMIADVGFGEAGLMRPVELLDGGESQQFGWTYRVVLESPGNWVLQSLDSKTWQDLYTFTLQPQYPIDYEVANWYVSTHPESIFYKTLTAQTMTSDARYGIRNRDFIVRHSDATTTRSIRDLPELLSLLAEIFRIQFPKDVRFRNWTD